jgi:hypothetical protein
MERARARSSRTPVAHAAQSRRAVSVWLWRLFWAAMLVMHMPSWVSVLLQDEFEPLRAAFLTFSQLFFLLKLIDVSWLRMPAGSRARWALVVLFVLLHGDVVRRFAVAEPVDTFVAPVAVFALGAMLLSVPSRGLRRAAREARRTQADALRRLLAQLCTGLDLVLLRPPRCALVRAGRVGRAPPA